ncbi:uncharacterized protein SPPG_01735 [Spizellomyces punctatus DAOM BR117]|uniref:PH domain-containing protein n=1 Tax=Spizellomyces punctatus (strain DAOM BR117) TaxID=645134 RepID=A0A0L0HNM8_SPIPD|nr:uncharacterized protein SPPG_01735 [Spizellomyces punctatus DAOM BR117]KND02648.1 hypothetical protein SPPG_01735 [Spizellomyces punctatus DAOM BR117]|eukprot:XP_016610687.1 hypothetical protein SPPG_01735 [Spizellomyces punctatus DAOM BR117]
MSLFSSEELDALYNKVQNVASRKPVSRGDERRGVQKGTPPRRADSSTDESDSDTTSSSDPEATPRPSFSRANLRPGHKVPKPQLSSGSSKPADIGGLLHAVADGPSYANASRAVQKGPSSPNRLSVRKPDSPPNSPPLVPTTKGRQSTDGSKSRPFSSLWKQTTPPQSKRPSTDSVHVEPTLTSPSSHARHARQKSATLVDISPPPSVGDSAIASVRLKNVLPLPVAQTQQEELPPLSADMEHLLPIIQTLSKKKYTDGYIYKKNELGVRGRPLSAKDEPEIKGDVNGEWGKFWAELRGTTLKLWRVPEHIIALTYNPTPTVDKVLRLELDPAPSTIATIKTAQPHPVVIDITESVVEVLPQNFQVKQGPGLATPPPVPYTTLFALSTAGSNLFYLASLSSIQCNTWVAAIRLAVFEAAKVSELFTLKMLKRATYATAWKDIGVVPFHSATHKHEIKYEGMVEVKYTYANEWKPFHVVVKRSGTASLGKKLFGGKKRASSLIPSDLDPLNGTKRQVGFYETKADVKKGKPVFTMDIVRMAYILQPEPLALVEKGAASVARLEGSLTLYDPESGERIEKRDMDAPMKDTFALVGPAGYAATADDPLRGFTNQTDARASPGFVDIRGVDSSEIARWLIAVLGTFNLDSDLARREKEIAEGEVGIAKRIKGQFSKDASDSGSGSESDEYSSGTMWGLLYLSVEEIGGLNMQGEVYASISVRYAEVLRDKTKAKTDGFIIQWNDAVAAGEEGRRKYEVREVEHKTAELVAWLGRMVVPSQEQKPGEGASRKSMVANRKSISADRVKDASNVNKDAAGTQESEVVTNEMNPVQPAVVTELAESVEKIDLTDAEKPEDGSEEPVQGINGETPGAETEGKNEPVIPLPEGVRSITGAPVVQTPGSETVPEVPSKELNVANGAEVPKEKPLPNQPQQLQQPVMMVPVPVMQPNGQWAWQYQYVDAAAYNAQFQAQNPAQPGNTNEEDEESSSTGDGSQSEQSDDSSVVEASTSKANLVPGMMIPGMGMPGMMMPMGMGMMPPMPVAVPPIAAKESSDSEEESESESEGEDTENKSEKTSKPKADGTKSEGDDEESDEDSESESETEGEDGQGKEGPVNNVGLMPGVMPSMIPGMMPMSGMIPGMPPMMMGPNGMIIGPNGMPLPIPPAQREQGNDNASANGEDENDEEAQDQGEFNLYAPQSLLAQLDERNKAAPRRPGPLIQLAPDVLEEQEQRLAKAAHGGSGPPPGAYMQPFMPYQDGPLLGKVDKEERKPKVVGGLLAEVDRREKEKEMLKKMGMYRPQVAGSYIPSYLRGGMAGLQRQSIMGPPAGMGVPMGPMGPMGPPMGMGMGMPPMGGFPAGAPPGAFGFPPGMMPPPGPWGMSPYGYPMSEMGEVYEDPATAMQREELRQQWLERERAKERQRMQERQVEWSGPQPQYLPTMRAPGMGLHPPPPQQFMWKREQSYSGSSSHSDRRPHRKRDSDDEESQSGTEETSDSGTEGSEEELSEDTVDLQRKTKPQKSKLEESEGTESDSDDVTGDSEVKKTKPGPNPKGKARKVPSDSDPSDASESESESTDDEPLVARMRPRGASFGNAPPVGYGYPGHGYAAPYGGPPQQHYGPPHGGYNPAMYQPQHLAPPSVQYGPPGMYAGGGYMSRGNPPMRRSFESPRTKSSAKSRDKTRSARKSGNKKPSNRKKKQSSRSRRSESSSASESVSESESAYSTEGSVSGTEESESEHERRKPKSSKPPPRKNETAKNDRRKGKERQKDKRKGKAKARKSRNESGSDSESV